MNKKIVLVLLLAIVLVVPLVSAATTYTPTTDKVCNELVCTQILYSGIRNVYEDDTWKRVENARSLKDKGFNVVYLEEDKDYPLEVIDFNSTSISLDLKHWSLFNDPVDLKIWKPNEESIISNFKGTYEKILDKDEVFNIFDFGSKAVVYNIKIGDIIEFGPNSTIILLQEADTENLDDSHVSKSSPNTNYGSNDGIEILSSGALNNRLYIKFNISVLNPTHKVVIANLSLYTSDSLDIDLSVYRVNYTSWDESSITWNNQPCGVNFDISKNCSFAASDTINVPDYPPTIWITFNVTNLVFDAVSDNSDNISFAIKNVSSAGSVVLLSKEHATAALRPKLTITYAQLYINITSPLNITHTTIPTTLNWTIGGDIEQACWYSSVLGGANTTVTCEDLNTAISPSQSSNTFTMWTNDTTGSETTSNVTFFVDSIAPSVNIIYPTETSVWFGWDTDLLYNVTIGLNWTATDTNLNISWFTNESVGTNQTLAPGLTNTSMYLAYGTYNFRVYANDSLGNLGSDSKSVKLAALINNSHTANLTSHETRRETFQINLTYDSVEFTTATAILNFSGVNYAADVSSSGDNIVFTKALDMPTGGVTAVNRSYFWNITLNNGSNQYYSTEATNIRVEPITFQECNATDSFSPFLNYTFQDEETNTNITAEVPNSLFEYWFGGGTVKDSYFFSDVVETGSYQFCFSLNETINMESSFQYKNDPLHIARTENFVGILSNDTKFQILYLTGTANGAFITFQIITTSGVGIPDARAQMERQISGAWTTINTVNSDDAGQVTFFLDITLNHRLTITHDDYQTEVLVIRPSQDIYTIVLQAIGGDPADYTSPYEGINYKINPPAGTWLSEDTVYSFTFNISANLSNLLYYSLNLSSNNGTALNSTSGTNSAGGFLNVTLNTAQHNIIYGRYYMSVANGTGVILLDPALWTVRNITAGRGSIYNFFLNIKDIDADMSDNYTTLMLLFFLMFVGMAAFTRATGMELSQPGICLIILCLFVLVVSITGFLTIDFAPSQFINQYGIALVAFLIAGGYTLGQFAKT